MYLGGLEINSPSRAGVSNGNGMEYGLRYIPGSNFNVYGYVRYVHPGSISD